MEILKWFSGNTKWKWKYWIMATFVQTCKFDLEDFIHYGCFGCGYTDQNGVFFLCSCTVTFFFTSAYLLITYHCMSKSIPFWEMFFYSESFLRALLCWCVCWWRPQEIETQSIIYSFYSASFLLTNTRPSKMEASP